MGPHPADVSDADLITFIDGWAALLGREDYEAAFALTDHVPEMRWTPPLIRQAIKNYGEFRPDQRVTADGVPTDKPQVREVDRWPTNARGCFGEIWYDLNIDGEASDLTATFALEWAEGGVVVKLNDIHVT